MIKLFANILFEKLHRYVFDYCFRCQNENWGVYTAYKRANVNNPYRKYNSVIQWFYMRLSPFFKGWRDNLKKHFPKGIYTQYY